MKKQSIKLLLMTMTLMMIMTGCMGKSRNDAESADSDNVAENPQPVSDEKMKYDNSIISMWLNEEGSCKLISDDDSEYTYEYCFRIPQINADTEGAKAINAEIKEKYSCIQDAIIDIKEDGILSWEHYIDFNNLNYKTFWNGNVVSIVVTGNAEYEYTDIFAACYDAKNGKKLTNEEIFKLGNISEEEWLRGIEKTVADETDKEFGLYSVDQDGSGYWDDSMSMYASILDIRAINISNQHINSKVPVYLNENGEVVGIIAIEGIADRGYNKELKPQTSFEGENFTSSMDDVIKATCDNGKITVIIEDCEWSRCSYLSGEFEFGTAYEVGGILKDYVDCTFIFLEDDTVCVPVFLSDDGMVSYIDLVQGTKCGYLCMTEPLMGFAGLKDLESNKDEIKTMLEKVFREKSNYFDSCLMGIRDYEWLGTTVEHKTDGEESYISNYSMGYGTEEDDYKFLVCDSMPKSGCDMNYEGTCRFMGMNSNGKIFSYEISDGESKYCGTFLLNIQGLWDELNEYYRVWAEYKYLGGADFFDSDGNELHFEKSMAVG